MRAFLIFMGLVVSLSAAFTAAILLARDEAHENQVAGAVKFVDQQIVASVTENRRAKPLYTTSVEPQPEPGVWSVTGRVAIEDGTGPTIEGNYIGIINSICDAYGEPRCWQLKTLTLDELELPSVVAETAAPADRIAVETAPRTEDARSRIAKALAAVSSEPLPPVPEGSESAEFVAQERDSLLYIVRDLNKLLGGLEQKVATLESENAMLGEKLQSVTWERDRLSENLSAWDLERGERSAEDGKAANGQAAVNQLQAQLDAAGQRIDGLTAELSTVGAERQALTKKLLAVAAERDALTERTASLATESEDLSPKIAGLTAEREALTTWVSQLTAEREALTAQVAELSAQGSVLSSQVAELTAERDGLAPKISELTTERAALNTRIGEMSSEIEGLSSWVERLTGESVSLSARLSELLIERQALSSQVATLSAETETLSTQVSQLTAERDGLATQVRAVTGERDQLSTRTNSLAGEAKALSSKVADLAAERDALSARVTALDGERDQLSSRVVALVAERETFTSKISAFASERDTFLNQVTNLTGERESLNAKVAELSAQPSTPSPDQAAFSSRLASLTTERDALSSQVERLTKQRDALSTRVAEITAQSRPVSPEPALPEPAVVAQLTSEREALAVQIADRIAQRDTPSLPLAEPTDQGQTAVAEQVAAPEQVAVAEQIEPEAADRIETETPQADPAPEPEVRGPEIETAVESAAPAPPTTSEPALEIETVNLAKRLKELTKRVDTADLETWLAENLSKLPATTKQDSGFRLPTDPAMVVGSQNLIELYQRQLVHAGFDPGPIDGRYGPRTGKALRSYQLAVGLSPSAGFDSPTLEALSRQRPAPNGSGSAAGGPAKIKLARAVYVAPEDLNRQNYKGLIAVLIGLLAVSLWFTGWRALFSRRSG